MWSYISHDELYHHGVKGQKWGVRNDKKKPPMSFETDSDGGGGGGDIDIEMPKEEDFLVQEADGTVHFDKAAYDSAVAKYQQFCIERGRSTVNGFLGG